jgi:hypothetical protein
MISIHVMAAQERTYSSYISRQVAAEGISRAWRPLESKQEGPARRESASAGTPGALRVGATEPGMEPSGHLVIEHWPGPGRASARHGGAQLCSLKRRRHPLPDRPNSRDPGPGPTRG